ncbi:hypothetical protein HYV31_02980 [candidate division WWE3 bacterium]|nr:hypothetical protein [candidate division WWE3 bacterium]
MYNSVNALKNSFLFGITIFLIFYVSFSFATYKDYGITADEELEYKGGSALVEYYKTGQNPTNLGLPERHLPTNTTYLRTYTAMLSVINYMNYFEWYHLLNLLFASVLFIVFYSIVFFESKNSYLALLGTVTLFLTPRIMGDIAANPKDIPFATMYLISFALIYFFSAKKFTRLNFLTLGVVLGITWGLRVVGLSLFIIYFVVNLVQMEKRDFTNVIVLLRKTLVLFMTSMVLLFMIWPYFRINFPQSLIYLIVNARSFEYWQGTMLFMGDVLTKYQRPASYLPIWFAISTPIYILIPFLLSGFTYTIKKRSIYTVGFVAILVNLLLYFLVNPVIYNGIRHFLYLLPIVTLIAFFAVVDLVTYLLPRYKKFSLLLCIGFGVGLVFTAHTMFLLHPYEYIYFNEIVGGLQGAKDKFELDYWFTSNKESAQWLSKNISDEPVLSVYSCNLPFSTRYFSSQMFEIAGKTSEASYRICDYDADKQSMVQSPVIYTVERFGVPISIIRKLN